MLTGSSARTALPTNRKRRVERIIFIEDFLMKLCWWHIAPARNKEFAVSAVTKAFRPSLRCCVRPNNGVKHDRSPSLACQLPRCGTPLLQRLDLSCEPPRKECPLSITRDIYGAAQKCRISGPDDKAPHAETLPSASLGGGSRVAAGSEGGNRSEARCPQRIRGCGLVHGATTRCGAPTAVPNTFSIARCA